MMMTCENQQDHENIEPQKFGATRLPAGYELATYYIGFLHL